MDNRKEGRQTHPINNLKAMLAVPLMLLCSGLHAEVGISGAVGMGAAHIHPVRFGIQKKFDRQWRTDSAWPIGGYWEGSVYAMRSQKALLSRGPKQIQSTALAGVFRFERAEKMLPGWPYIELGIGLAWLSQKEIAGRRLGLHLQFEDRVGIGFRFGKDREFDIGYKAIHFSNAYLGPINHGINLHLLMLGYWF